MSFKFNPFTGKLDITNDKNFSFEKISTGITVNIPVDQQMIVLDEIVIEGILIISGTLRVIDG